jgi:outer membrane protein assembly factor BamB
MHKAKLLITGLIGIAIFSCVLVMWPKAKSSPPESRDFPLNLLWTFGADDNIWRPPRLAGDLVIFSVSKPWPLNIFYYALNSGDGNLAWKYEAANDLGIWGERSFENTHSAVILSGNTMVVAVSLMTGEKAWASSGYSALTDIASNEDTIFVSSRGRLTALNATTGVIQWRNDSLPGYSLLVFYDDSTNTLVVPHNNIYRLDATDGTILSTLGVDKSFRLACNDWLENIRLYDGLIFCGATAIDAMTGQIVSDKYKENVGRGWPLIQSDVLYLTTASGTVQAIDLNKFNKLWEYEPENDKGRVDILSGIAIIDNVGYAIADDGTLRAFDISNGEEIGWWSSPEGVTDWRGVIGGYSDGTPLAGVVSDGKKLYVSFGGKTLYAFGLPDGQ